MSFTYSFTCAQGRDAARMAKSFDAEERMLVVGKQYKGITLTHFTDKKLRPKVVSLHCLDLLITVLILCANPMCSRAFAHLGCSKCGLQTVLAHGSAANSAGRH